MSELALTPGQMALLERLANAPTGCLVAKDLSIGEKRIATRLRRAGLVRPRAPLGTPRHSYEGKVLHITGAGLELVWKARRRARIVPPLSRCS